MHAAIIVPIVAFSCHQMVTELLLCAYKTKEKLPVINEQNKKAVKLENYVIFLVVCFISVYFSLFDFNHEAKPELLVCAVRTSKKRNMVI